MVPALEAAMPASRRGAGFYENVGSTLVTIMVKGDVVAALLRGGGAAAAAGKADG